MSESKFTPGPWVWVGRHLIAQSSVDDVPSDSYREVSIIDDGSANGEYKAVLDVSGPNAKLIAAAPCLLKEMTVIRETLPHIGLDAATRVEMLRRIEAVIAKATA